MKRPFLLVTFIFCLILSTFAGKITVKEGVLDLRDISFDSVGTVYVSGEWEFYGGKLLTPENINDFKPDTFLNIPGYFGDVGFPQVGVGTIRVKILTAGLRDYLTVYVNDVLCSYKIWLNGVLMGEVGKVDLFESKPLYYPMVFNLPSKVEENEIIIQIANHSHRFGGIYSSIKIGTPKEVMIFRFWITAKNLIAFTALVVMAIYNLMMFRLRRKELPFFYMGLFALLLGFRSLLSEEKLIIYLFKEFDWEWMYKLDLLGFYLAVPLFLTYFTKMFKEASFIPLVRVLQVSLYCFSVVVLFNPVSKHIFLLDYAHLIIFIAVIHTLIGLVVALVKKLPNSRLFALAVVVLASCTINDILYHQDVIASVELTQFGSVSFIYFQTYELYRRFTKTFEENELLTVKLEEENKSLESRVEDRTSELRKVNEELLINQEELIKLTRSLENASQDISRQKRELELQNNKLTQSITYAARIQNSLLPTKQKLNQFFGENYFVLWRPRDIVGGDFYWAQQVGSKMLIAGGDCTGHGVPGALITMICISLLNEILRRPDINSPALVLEFMRERIKSMLYQNSQDRQDGADLVFLEFDLTTNHLVFSDAKMGMLIVRHISGLPFQESNHCKVVKIGDYQLARIIGGKQPVGPHPSETPFFNLHLEIEQGDKFYVFTDGLQDQFGGKLDSKLGLRALMQMIVESQKPRIASQLPDFEALFDKWRGERAQIDDIMMLAFEWRVKPKTKLLV